MSIESRYHAEYKRRVANTTFQDTIQKIQNKYNDIQQLPADQRYVAVSEMRELLRQLGIVIIQDLWPKPQPGTERQVTFTEESTSTPTTTMTVPPIPKPT